MRITTRVALGAVISAMFAVPTASAQVAPKLAPRPTPGPAKALTFPKIVPQTLPNGLRLVVIENHSLPIVSVRIALGGGAFLDAPGKEGGWSLTTAMLREGTETRSASTIANAMADLGTTLVWNLSSTGQGAPEFTTIHSAWKPVLELVADMLMHPSFPAEALRRVQGIQGAAVARPSQQANAVRLLNATTNGVDHPYGRFVTEASVRGLTRDDLIAVHAAYLRPQNTSIVVAGDVIPAEARRAVEEAFGAWRREGTTIETNIPAPAAPASPTTIYLRDDPGAATATIYTGSAITSRMGSDAAAIELVNLALGGTSTAGRLWQAFRVDRGLSYSPTTIFVWRPEPQVGSWYGTAQVAVAKVDTAVVEWIRVLRETRRDRPLTAEEFDFARKNLVGALPGLLETVSGQANATRDLLQNRLPETFYSDYLARVNALTLDQVRTAAAKYLDTDHMVIAVVGDRAKIEAPLRATGIPVVIVDR